MRQFKILIQWGQDDHVDEIIYTFLPEHTKEITADEFISMMSPCVLKTISECDETARLYIENNLIDPDLTSEFGAGTIQSVEEI